ncbi:ArnT family glycosyltransferase [Nocardia stercoris]|uniref:Uncharacterized protein n=1 Tax=Nocardia stercoris TaxID=2483361 RepID=A0A3M2LC61_9NOCA|nr:glycosyltransferase family 39 protein [Nocardia stercoris]RMI34300.1 hypothetical protein EBN03_07860 [Nocardia stercoris]
MTERTLAVSSDESPRRGRRAALRAPEGQPVWVLPALIAVAALAAVSYSWGIAHRSPHLFYAAAARSMALNWHNFCYAAFDPAGTVSIDKLPGAVWIQALSVKMFGPHLWALMLPQVVEGVATVFLLFAAVRRIAGPVAGLIAAVVLACTPAVTALDRGNLPDTLMILLLVAAADRVLVAVAESRPRQLWWAGLLLGLAFQAKMIQAWVVVPAFALACLVAGTVPWWRRVRDLAIFAAIALVVGLAWMSVVSLIGRAHRPYVDGSPDDSLFHQVFVYNAADRTDSGFSVGAANLATGPDGRNLRSAMVFGPGDHWAHVFTGAAGRSIGVLVPLALVALAGLVWTHRGRRTPKITAALIIWGGWLLTYLVVFLAVGTVNPYYLATLAVPVAVLLGWAGTEYVAAQSNSVRRILPLVVAATGLYGWWVLAPATHDVRWIVLALVLALSAAALLWRAAGAAVLLLVAVLAAPAVASAEVVHAGYGALDTPYESTAVSDVTQRITMNAIAGAPRLIGSAQRAYPTARYPAVTYTSIIGAPFIYVTGAEIATIGGFTGTAPVLTIADIETLVSQHQIGFALLNPSDDARVRWIEQHCKQLPSQPGDIIEIYACAPMAH